MTVRGCARQNSFMQLCVDIPCRLPLYHCVSFSPPPTTHGTQRGRLGYLALAGGSPYGSPLQPPPRGGSIKRRPAAARCRCRARS